MKILNQARTWQGKPVMWVLVDGDIWVWTSQRPWPLDWAKMGAWDGEDDDDH